MQYTATEIKKVVKGQYFSANKNQFTITQIATDTRKLLLSRDTCFVALRGLNFDGHQFLEEAYAKGVRVFITDKNLSARFKDAVFIVVQDTLLALQMIATFHRKHFDIPVIGITGSNGKTIIKEWLYQLVHGDLQICRSPKSFNSQVGVPLSVLQLTRNDQLGIFEAGISKPNEMQRIETMVKPTLGIFTNIGPAHDAGFSSIGEKVKEKLKLFKDCEKIIYCKDHTIIDTYLRENDNTVTWGEDEDADYVVQILTLKPSLTKVTIQYCEQIFHFDVPFAEKAYIENCLHCIITLMLLGYDIEVLQSRLAYLKILPMRMELKYGINRCTLIDDSYSADILSLQVALDFMRQQQTNQKKTLIISTFEESGITDIVFIKKIIQIIRDYHFDKIIGVGQAFVKNTFEFFKLNIEFHSFPTTDSLIKGFSGLKFDNELILLKGSRNYQFERVTYELLGQTHKTILEINLNALIDNLNVYKSLVPPETGIIPMVKAFSYGSGTTEIATLLEEQNVPYLAVAYVDEGVRLRQMGITIPIMVLNADIFEYRKMVEYNLEPEIYSIEMLYKIISIIDDDHNERLPIHIKIETGMNRLGIVEEDIDMLIDILGNQDKLYVKTVFSHLAASDEPTMDNYTKEQIQVFESLTDRISKDLDYHFGRHICNSSGIVRFPKAHYDYVRLGIGLYGVDSGNTIQHRLQTIGVLKSRIAQIKEVKSGGTIGYSRKGKANGDKTIAIVAIGYADGFDRRFSNGIGKMYIRGQIAPVIGNVCMDMTMIDITHISGVTTGDEVEVFGKNISIIDAAANIGTIAYELLTGISERVKRVYYYE
jgi:alanine racemase